MARPKKFTDAKASRITVLMHPEVLGQVRLAASSAGLSAGDWLTAAANIKFACDLVKRMQRDEKIEEYVECA